MASHNELGGILGQSLVNPSYSGSFDEGVYGGCDEKYGMGGFVAVLLLITAILLLYYVTMFVSDMKSRENVCGGKDQGCLCDGNEMLTGGKSSTKWNSALQKSSVTEGILSQTAAGM